MSIWMMIIAGVVVISVAGVLGDTISNIAKSKAKAREKIADDAAEELGALKDRVAALESRLSDRDDEVRKLQDEVRFVNRMLEDKTGASSKN
jgi:hypothetical protein